MVSINFHTVKWILLPGRTAAIDIRVGESALLRGLAGGALQELVEARIEIYVIKILYYSRLENL